MREREERKGRGAKNNSNGLKRLLYYKYKSERGIIEPFSLFPSHLSIPSSLSLSPLLFLFIIFLFTHDPQWPPIEFHPFKKKDGGGGREKWKGKGSWRAIGKDGVTYSTNRKA